MVVGVAGVKHVRQRGPDVSGEADGNSPPEKSCGGAASVLA